MEFDGWFAAAEDVRVKVAIWGEMLGLRRERRRERRWADCVDEVKMRIRGVVVLVGDSVVFDNLTDFEG